MKHKPSLGSVSSAKYFLSAPLKFEFLNLPLNKLNILAGLNGSGKSFINASVWAMNCIMSAKILSKSHNVPFDEVKEAQFILENSLSPNLTGTMGLMYESSGTIDVAIKDGQVLGVTFNAIDDIEEPTGSIYMSAALRTFNSITNYLGSRKACGKTDSGEVIQEMVKYYKLYDIMYVERLISRMPVAVDEEFKRHLDSFGIKEEIKTFSVDLDECGFYAIFKDGSKHFLHQWFGSGHQSLLNMLLGQFISK